MYLKQNMKLIREVNELRHELKLARSKVKNLESFSPIKTSLRASSSAPLKKHHLISSDQADINNCLTLKMELQEKNKLVELQHKEILKLRYLAQAFDPPVVQKPSPAQKLSPLPVE